MIAMLCGSLALPVLMVGLSSIRVPLPRVPLRQDDRFWVLDRTEPPFGGTRAALPGGTKGVAQAYDWSKLALAIYLAVTAVLLLRLGAGLAISGRLLRRARATGRTTHGIAILESDDVPGPLVLGIVRPSIRHSIFGALRQQLGLELRAETAAVEYFVIDHAERPR